MMLGEAGQYVYSYTYSGYDSHSWLGQTQGKSTFMQQ